MQKLMTEPALQFFCMLEEAYKIQAEEAMLQTNIRMLAHMDEKDRNHFIHNLQTLTYGVPPADDYSSLERLKGML